MSTPVNNEQIETVDNPIPDANAKLPGSAVKDSILYGAARTVLFLVLTFVIHSIVILMGMAHTFPLLISAMLALLLALPLSMLMFKKLRLRVTEQFALRDAKRKAHKDQMRRQLQERLS